MTESGAFSLGQLLCYYLLFPFRQIWHATTLNFKTFQYRRKPVFPRNLFSCHKNKWKIENNSGIVWNVTMFFLQFNIKTLLLWYVFCFVYNVNVLNLGLLVYFYIKVFPVLVITEFFFFSNMIKTITWSIPYQLRSKYHIAPNDLSKFTTPICPVLHIKQ